MRGLPPLWLKLHIAPKKSLHPIRCICIYLAMSADLRLLDLDCMCASVRRLARGLTQLYDGILEPSGLRSTQFTILQVLERAGELKQGQIAEALSIDSTTLTRTLALLLREKWIAARSGSDRRERWFRLTAKGRAKYASALPLWHQAQQKAQALLSDQRWSALLQESNLAAHRLREAQEGEHRGR
jgi:DNA-binding MarR family transcriptional regulator